MSQEKDTTGFLSRWSQRKLGDAELPKQVDVEHVDDGTVPPAERSTIEPESDEAKSIWQRDDVDAETKKNALRTLFRKPEFNVRDGLNEYDDDFTQFASLGNILTHEMKRMLKLAEEKTRPDSSEQGSATSAENEPAKPQSNNEDKDLA